MNKIVTSLLTGVLMLSLATGAALASSPTSTIGQGQGVGQGMDINAYCTHIGQGINSSVITGTQNWACSNNGTGTAIDLHAVCQYEHPGLNSVKEEVNGDPLTWNCLK